MAPMGGDIGSPGSWLSWNPYGHGTLGLLAAGGGMVLWAVIESICLLGLYTARKRYSERPRSPLSSAEPFQVPGVSIIRPLRGLDPNLFYNLASTLTLDYPSSRYEVLFCVQSATDQALEVVRELLDKYPDVNARVVVAKEGEELGVNPKINNLKGAFDEAKYDIVWVLDATVSVMPSTLARSVEALVTPKSALGRRPSAVDGTNPAGEQEALLPGEEDERWSGEVSGVGLVHHIPFAWVPDKSFGSRLEQAYLNSTHAKMYLAINATQIDSCVVGKSNLYRKSSVKRLHYPLTALPSDDPANPPTGLRAFAPFLPEDNLIAMAIMHQLKLSHKMTPDLAMDCLGPIDVSGYVARRVRWQRVRKRMTFSATMIEPLTESLLLGVIAAASAHALVGIPGWLFFVLHEAGWLWTDLSVMAALKGEWLRASELGEFLVAWACRELLALPIWLKAMVGDTVVWRGVTYKILPTGEAIKVQ